MTCSAARDRTHPTLADHLARNNSTCVMPRAEDHEARRRRREIEASNCICKEPRAVSNIQVLRSSFQIQRGAAERPASPAAHSTEVRPSLADESRAIRGRVHAVVRCGVD